MKLIPDLEALGAQEPVQSIDHEGAVADGDGRGTGVSVSGALCDPHADAVRSRGLQQLEGARDQLEHFPVGAPAEEIGRCTGQYRTRQRLQPLTLFGVGAGFDDLQDTLQQLGGGLDPRLAIPLAS